MSPLPLIPPGIRTKRILPYNRSGGSGNFVLIKPGEAKALAEIEGGANGDGRANS